MSVRDDMTEEVTQLKRVMSALRAKLEPVEDYQALRQLDDRERGQDPLAAIDGVMLRGRLARRLEETNQHWRALVRLEAALAALEVGTETGIDHVRVPVRLSTLDEELAPRIAAAQPDAMSSESAPHRSSSPANRPSEPANAAQLEPQRPSENRASSPSALAPAHGYTRPPVPLSPTVRKVSPLSKIQAPPPATPAEDPHRSILDRIKPITTVARAATTTDATQAQESWRRGIATPLPPAIDAPATPPEAKPPAPKPVSPPPATSVMAPRSAVPAVAKAQIPSAAPPDRVSALEVELARLVEADKVATAAAPVANAVKPPRMTSPAAPKPVQRADIDPRAGDVPEAEVSIVKLPDPPPGNRSQFKTAERSEVQRDRPWLPDRTLVRRSLQERVPPERARPNRGLSRLTPWRRDRKAANDDHASLGYEPLDVEEAEVEIIVATQAGGAKEPRLS